MEITVRKYEKKDFSAMTEIWNAIVLEGRSFPQDEPMDLREAEKFFSAQSFTGVAIKEQQVVGLYILHPNNAGRCAHIANASYGVKAGERGYGIGEKLVLHSLACCRKMGFKGLQFNAVLSNNTAAIALYEKLGFKRIGTIPGGYRISRDVFEDILIFFKDCI
jgi:L-amino acid N-acyltransferase YncA